METKLYFYHSNDLHSNLGQWPKMMDYFESARALHEQKHEAAMFFDIGDHVDRSHPITESSLGKFNVELMNLAGYDFVTFGNNEGITLPHESLDSLYEEANFTVLGANLYDVDGTRPDWVKPYGVKELEGGIKAGVIGVTVPFKSFYRQLGWKVEDPFEMLQDLIMEVREKADIIILLSHLGMNDDRRIAEQMAGIDIILGGHTHHLLKNGEYVNGTLIGQAGKFGHYVGQVAVTYDLEEGKITDKKAWAVPVDNMEGNQKAFFELQRLENESKIMLSETITELDEPLPVDWYGETRFASLLADGLKDWCSAEASMVNAGVLLSGLGKGPVSKADIHKVCPHPINPCKVELPGDKLSEVIHQAFTDDMQGLKIRGLGFRGKVMGRMVFSGIDVKTKKMADGLTHVTEIKVNGNPIDGDRMYEIATVDMFTFGPLYPEISHSPKKRYYMPEMLRDVLTWQLGRVFG
ncbi:bifunctional metallophosphatase/5'-nucleotidase [Bacillus marinisedimentorum]|uniref:bifunctional metallophosphatase/5'-nucleotidase n=1 Tax=Bacillus marinisedimentorum TaxID=1821260 RepID=UPI000871D511|nr:bifunctional UDP-sugar hydrolase/5'-nucleotidase [Bacillus marinisedimentorum]